MNWIYLFIKNNSGNGCFFAKIIDSDGIAINIYNNWSNHVIQSGNCVGMIVEGYKMPSKIVLNYNTYDLEYKITDAVGIPPFKLK